MNEQLLIVLIHGHGVDATIWAGVDAGLSAHAPVVVPDFARVATHTSLDEYAELLHKQLSAETGGTGRVILVGHSMGGYIALAFAEKYPNMVAGLVLFHSTAYADDEARKMQRQQTIQSLNTHGAAQFIEKTLPKMVAPNFPASKLQPYIDLYKALPADALAAGMTAIMNRPDRTSVLRDAQFPILLVLGEEDQVIPFEKTVALGDLSHQISVAPIRQAGHLSMVEQPELALGVLRVFVSQILRPE